MDKSQFYPWLEQRQERLVELICEETEKASRAIGKTEVELVPRVQRWVENFLHYVESGDIRIMIQQIEDATRQKLVRKEKLDLESAEVQARYIMKALNRLVHESVLKPSEQEWFSQQMQRSMTILNTNARLVYSRLILEQISDSDS